MRAKIVFTITKTFSFCYGHRLLDDKGRCRNLHGHTAKAAFTLRSKDLDRSGMVAHFDRIKETVGRWIEENLDHCMLLCERDPAAGALAALGERYLPMKENPTAENIARMLFEKAMEFGLAVEKVEVWESESSKASYQKR